ncbi:MAG TPA: proline dehydrogenase family protein [Bacteroidota bacterium]|nr:proline dehydrogenase family protein [Bacteroidota bacterium]
MRNPWTSAREAAVRRLTASHLAGPAIEDALRIYGEARKRGWTGIISPWLSGDLHPGAAAASFSSALRAIIKNAPDCHLSIKIQAVRYDAASLEELFTLSAEHGIRICIDSLDISTADPTHSFIDSVLPRWKNLGCTLPARWRRSLDDARRVIEWGIPVRIVKGQWSDGITTNSECRRSYLKIVDLLAGKVPVIGVATHDRSLAQDALRRLTAANAKCEMEQLSCLPQNCHSLASSLDVPFRIYVPYGFPSLPYSVRSVSTRPAVVVWALRDFIAGRHRKLAPVDRR